VINTLKRALELNVVWETVKDWTNEELAKKLFPSYAVSTSYRKPDYDYIHREMAKSGVTLSLLWVEYCEQCRGSGFLPYKQTQFNKYYRDYVHKTKATMHLEHKPGEIMEVDWAGQKIPITDTDTGELIKISVFVSVLPYSGYAYVEGFLSQNQESWTTAYVNAYNYFGGVTRILVPDNLKTGVLKNTRDETVINKTYLDLAEHYGTAIIPTRPHSPKDKATVEKSVSVVSTWIIAALRNNQFLSLRELNEAIHQKLVEFNHKEFQMKDGSRASRFEEEKMFLLPLPERPYELAIWKIATVQYNYHITVEIRITPVPTNISNRRWMFGSQRILLRYSTTVHVLPLILDSMGSPSITAQFKSICHQTIRNILPGMVSGSKNGHEALARVLMR